MMTTTKTRDGLNRLSSIQSLPTASPAIASTYTYHSAKNGSVRHGCGWSHRTRRWGPVAPG